MTWGSQRLRTTTEVAIGPPAPESKLPSQDQAEEDGPQARVWTEGPLTGHLAPQGDRGAAGTSLLASRVLSLAEPTSCLSSPVTTSHF